MARTRLYLPQGMSAGQSVALDKDQSHYLGRVLRMRRGDGLSVFDGRGAEFDATIASLTRDGAVLELGATVPPLPESPLSVCLVQGISRGERMDYTIQKATELGVARIRAVVTARSVVRLDERRAEKRLDHWRRVAVAASEQCGRSRVPQLDPPEPLPAALAAATDGLRLVAVPDSERLLTDVKPPELTASDGALSVELLVGPEGGLEEEEILAAESAGYRPVSLGPRVLRSETAGIVAIAILQSLYGDLRRD